MKQWQEVFMVIALLFAIVWPWIPVIHAGIPVAGVVAAGVYDLVLGIIFWRE